MMPIGEVSRLSGVPSSAIRYYEKLGILPAPTRESGRRRYSDEVLARLVVIRFARASGFRLAEVRRLFSGALYSSRLRGLASAKIDELQATITRARAMQALLASVLRCRCLTLEECGRRLDKARRTAATPAAIRAPGRRARSRSSAR